MMTSPSNEFIHGDLDRDVKWYYAELQTKRPISREDTVREHSAGVNIGTILDEVTDDLGKVLGLSFRQFCGLLDREILREDPEKWTIYPTSVAHFFGKMHRDQLRRIIAREPSIVRKLTDLYKISTSPRHDPENAQLKIDVISPNVLLAPSTTNVKFGRVMERSIPPEVIQAIGPEVLVRMTTRRINLIAEALAEENPSPILAARAIKRLGGEELLASSEEDFTDNFSEALSRVRVQRR